MIHKMLAVVMTVLSEVAEAASGSADVVAQWVSAEVAKASDAVKAGITDGHLRPSRGEVVVTAKASGKDKDATRPYLKLDALDAQGQAILCGGKFAPATEKPEGEDKRTDTDKAPGACDYFNYGYDLDVRQKVRSALMTELEGPEKAIKKAVDNLVANAGMSESAAREFVIAQRTKAGLAV